MHFVEGKVMKQALAIIALLAVVLAVGMYAAGWLTFERTPGRASIELNTEKIDEATQRAAEGSREMVNEAADSVEQATKKPVDSDANSPDAERPLLEVKTESETTTVTR